MKTTESSGLVDFLEHAAEAHPKREMNDQNDSIAKRDVVLTVDREIRTYQHE